MVAMLILMKIISSTNNNTQRIANVAIHRPHNRTSPSLITPLLLYNLLLQNRTQHKR